MSAVWTYIFLPYLTRGPACLYAKALQYARREKEDIFDTRGRVRTFQDVIWNIIAISDPDILFLKLINIYVDLQDYLDLRWSYTIEDSALRVQLMDVHRFEVRKILTRMDREGVCNVQMRHLFHFFHRGDVGVLKKLIRIPEFEIQILQNWVRDSLEELGKFKRFLNASRRLNIHLNEYVERGFYLGGVFRNGLFSAFHENVRRRLLALFAIQIMSFRKRREALAYEECLRTFFIILPDSFVTVREMKKLIQEIFRNNEFEFRMLDLRKLADIYVECEEPATLLDSSRRLVRATLLENGQCLHSAAEKLGLPNKLKKFIVSK